MTAVQESTEYNKNIDIEINEIAEFICNHFNEMRNQKFKITQIIKEHIKFGTFDYEKDDKGIIYTARWNVSRSGNICDLLDVAIRKDYRNKNALKYIIIKNLQKFPFMKYLRFQRYYKYKYRASRIYSFNKILKIKGG